MKDWDVVIKIPPPFTKDVISIPISDTGMKETCVSCGGSGQFKCTHCDRGRIDCDVCEGRGRFIDDKHICKLCSACSASGKKICSICQGSGFEKCSICKGNRSLTTYTIVIFMILL